MADVSSTSHISNSDLPPKDTLPPNPVESPLPLLSTLTTYTNPIYIYSLHHSLMTTTAVPRLLHAFQHRIDPATFPFTTYISCLLIHLPNLHPSMGTGLVALRVTSRHLAGSVLDLDPSLDPDPDLDPDLELDLCGWRFVGADAHAELQELCEETQHRGEEISALLEDRHEIPPWTAEHRVWYRMALETVLSGQDVVEEEWAPLTWRVGMLDELMMESLAERVPILAWEDERERAGLVAEIQELNRGGGEAGAERVAEVMGGDVEEMGAVSQTAEISDAGLEEGPETGEQMGMGDDGTAGDEFKTWWSGFEKRARLASFDLRQWMAMYSKRQDSQAAPGEQQQMQQPNQPEDAQQTEQTKKKKNRKKRKKPKKEPTAPTSPRPPTAGPSKPTTVEDISPTGTAAEPVAIGPTQKDGEAPAQAAATEDLEAEKALFKKKLGRVFSRLALRSGSPVVCRLLEFGGDGTVTDGRVGGSGT